MHTALRRKARAHTHTDRHTHTKQNKTKDSEGNRIDTAAALKERCYIKEEEGVTRGRMR